LKRNYLTILKWWKLIKKFSALTKSHRLKAISLFQRELNHSVTSLYNSVQDIQHFLKGNYRSVLQLKETSKVRLEQLKASMLDAEQEFNVILDVEKEENLELKKSLDKKPNTLIKKFINNLISDISVAADNLESQLDDGSFEHELHANEISIETVVKLHDGDKGEDENEGVVMLVDSDSNHYVLSKPKDSTTTHVDHLLLREIIFLIMVSFLLIIVCNLLKLPSMFACIIAGVILGPSGGGYLKSIVQIETFGEFGVFFILFCVGLEFSIENVRKVIRNSIIGSFGIMISYVFIGLIFGWIIGFTVQQIIFVTICLSFSSTPVVTKLIAQSTVKDHNLAHSTDDYSSLLMSMLVIQDILLGIFMAILPILAGHTASTHSFSNVPGNHAVHFWFHGTFGGTSELVFFTIIELTFALLGFLFISFVLSKYIGAKFFRGLNLFGSHECFVLGVVSVMFVMLTISENFGISMELGCFTCGAIISSMGEQVVKQVSNIVESFRDFFSCLFFASIGFHIFPSFVVSELAIFVPITILVIVIKFVVTSSVLNYLLPKGNNSKWMVAAGLSQISEFSFVLCSRARRFGLIGREVYLIILSVTTLSLLIAPFSWQYTYSSITQQTKSWTIKSIVKKFTAKV